MKHIIIDTNVPLKAANMHPEDETDRKCSIACLDFLRVLMDGNSESIVVVDQNWEIIKEYKKNINLHSDDNVATQFLTWVLTNGLRERVIKYAITKTSEGYMEFPNSKELEKFDRSDKKFVALAKVDPENPTIYNGSDTDWWIFKDALKKEGIIICFLSEEYMMKKCRQ